ncbi:MAG TPA: acyltransferase [Povalibacter sp.]
MSQTADQNGVPQLTPLTGVRFFAVFHIFIYHIWSSRNERPAGDNDQRFADMYAGLDTLPQWLSNIIAHGYLSTSFFFLLSGFILAYLYWAPNGALSTSPRRFWWTRLSRIYPAHLIVLSVTVLLTMPRFFVDPTAPPIWVGIASALATGTLTQAWFPPLVPIFSWPTWALSAIVFLYFLTPWLMRWLARLSRRQMIVLLTVMPAISLAPTLIFLLFVPDGGAKNLNLEIFIGATPLFWVAHFAAGMLLSRIFGISRFNQAWRDKPRPWLALGDIALVAVILLSMTDPQSLPWRHILRHGLLMPLYLVALYDLALGRGLFARLFSLPGMNALGQLSFSIFIWQNFLMIVSFIVVYVNPAAVDAALWIVILGLLVVSALSTHFIEKPLAARLRRRFADKETVPMPAIGAQGVTGP